MPGRRLKPTGLERLFGREALGRIRFELYHFIIVSLLLVQYEHHDKVSITKKKWNFLITFISSRGLSTTYGIPYQTDLRKSSTNYRALLREPAR